MKEKELYVDFKPQQLVYYVEKDDSSYGPIISGSQLSANYLDDFMEKRGKLELSLRNQVMNNEVSPVYYYTILQEIGHKDLASRVGISLRKLEKIFKPDGFRNISLDLLRSFSVVFDVPITDMLQSFQIKEDDREKIEIEQSETKNSLFNITRIKLK